MVAPAWLSRVRQEICLRPARKEGSVQVQGEPPRWGSSLVANSERPLTSLRGDAFSWSWGLGHMHTYVE